MPIDYSIDHDHRLVSVRAWGVLTDAELTAHAERFTSDPQATLGYDQLADFREVEDFDAVSAEAVRAGARSLNAFEQDAHGVRLAILATEAAAFGLSRLYELERGDSPVEIRVFRDEEEARSWLQRPDSG